MQQAKPTENSLVAERGVRSRCEKLKRVDRWLLAARRIRASAPPQPYSALEISEKPGGPRLAFEQTTLLRVSIAASDPFVVVREQLA